MRISAVVALAILAAGCRPSRPATPGGAPLPTVDSIVLERTPCFGTCPSYRLSLSRLGAVHFHSRNPDDTTRVETGRIAPEAFAALAGEAAAIGFGRLPDSIAQSALCGAKRSDHPSAIVALFSGARVKRVDDYLGCPGGPESLRRFEARIDSVAGSSRWVRPASRR